MKKILPILSILCLVVSIAGMAMAVPAMAKPNMTPAAQIELPDQAGIYAVPGRPDLKLRVFVYHAKPDNPGKPAKPEPPAPELKCDLDDLDSNAEVGLAGWYLPTTWTYNLNPNSVPSSVGSENLAAITDNAFNAWLNEINGVSATRGANTNLTRAKIDGQNIVAWGRTPSSALAVTYTWYYTDTGLAAEIDTLMNSKVGWAWSDPNSWAGKICAYADVYDVQNILTHEIGHTFGLADEYTSEFVNNTMYGYGSKMETKKDTLTTGDIAGVNNIY